MERKNDTKQCVKCGYCCTIGICKFGRWNEARNQCQFLTKANLCGIYEKIKDDNEIGFGKGCSSALFNTVRLKKL